MSLNNAEKAFVRWTLKYLVSENTVNINPEGKFFFRKKFFEEMKHQENQLNDLGKKHGQSIQKKYALNNVQLTKTCLNFS